MKLFSIINRKDTSELRFDTVELFVCGVPSKITFTLTSQRQLRLLEDNIRETIGEIKLHTIDNVLKNWTNCVGYCMASRGSHLNEIIFHY